MSFIGKVLVGGLALSVQLLVGAAAQAAQMEFFDDAAASAFERFEVFCNGGTCDPGADGIGRLAAPLYRLSPGAGAGGFGPGGSTVGSYLDNDSPATQKGQLFNIVTAGYAGPGRGQNDLRELNFVNDNLYVAGDGPFAYGTKVDAGGRSNVTFTSSARYILFVLGTQPRTGLAVNLSDAPITYTFSQVGQGAGLSHYVEYGEVGTVSAVPLPAGVWLVLTGIAGLGYLGGRRRRAIP